MKITNLLIMIAAFITLTACGGGGGGAGDPGTPGTPGTTTTNTSATVAFTSSASVPNTSAPLQGIKMKVNLPTGCSISNISEALTVYLGTLDSSTLSYSPADNTVFFQITKIPSISFGKFADLKCAITPDLTANSFTSINTPSFPTLELTGVSTTNGTSVNLVPEIKVDMSVTLQ